ncbi:hypothetical protein CDAR_224691 [Caerostris darwini]|uniref:Uncharacterized protein n=1 Tax=Caerostris darwini TaxID=1538125 RepID=A0AAV4NA76_9ARAC|nr:hypothetical protein CDAR_224691 [Caerostris darwini]
MTSVKCATSTHSNSLEIDGTPKALKSKPRILDKEGFVIPLKHIIAKTNEICQPLLQHPIKIKTYSLNGFNNAETINNKTMQKLYYPPFFINSDKKNGQKVSRLQLPLSGEHFLS